MMAVLLEPPFSLSSFTAFLIIAVKGGCAVSPFVFLGDGAFFLGEAAAVVFLAGMISSLI